MEICVASGNAGKLAEFRRILEGQGHTVKSAAELGCFIDPDETGNTFEENAVIKAREICAAVGMPTIADDSGLEVTALRGAPGVHSARYCGHHGDDAANNEKLLFEMQGVEDGKRGAKFVSVLCLCMPNGALLTTHGECPGTVGHEGRGENGFGYDPLFYPSAYAPLSYAQLTAQQKDAISHRGKALAVLAEKLPAFLQENA